MSSDDDVVIIDTSDSEQRLPEDANFFSESRDIESSPQSSERNEVNGDLVHSDVIAPAVVKVDAGVNTSVHIEEDMERRLHDNLLHLGESLSTLKTPFSGLEAVHASTPFLARKEKLKNLKRSRVDEITKTEPFSPAEPAFPATDFGVSATPTWLPGLTDCLSELGKASAKYFGEKDTLVQAPCFLLSPVEGCTASQRNASESHEADKHLRASYEKLKEKLKATDAILRSEGADSLESIYGELQLLRQRSKESARSQAADAARVLSEQDLLFQELIAMLNSKHMYYSRKFFDRCIEPGDSVATLQQDLDKLTVFQRKLKEIVESMPSVAHAPRALPVAVSRLAGRSAEIVYQTLEKERAQLKHENEKLAQQLSNAQNERRNLLAAFQLADEKEVVAKLSTIDQVIVSCGEQRRKNLESVAASLGWEVQRVSTNEVVLRNTETNEVRHVALVEKVAAEKHLTFAEQAAALQVDLPPLPSDSDDFQSVHSCEGAEAVSPVTSTDHNSTLDPLEEHKTVEEQEEHEKDSLPSLSSNSNMEEADVDEKDVKEKVMNDLPSLPSSSEERSEAV